MIEYGYVLDAEGKRVIRVRRVKDEIVFDFLAPLPKEDKKYFLDIQRRATEYFQGILARTQREPEDQLMITDASVIDFVGAACRGEIEGGERVRGRYFWPSLVNDMVFPEVQNKNRSKEP